VKVYVVNCVVFNTGAVYTIHNEWSSSVPQGLDCHGNQFSLAAATSH